MTIARRLIVLVAVPLLALIGLGIFIRVQLAEVETLSRFVAETQIDSLATLGNISRSFSELRVRARDHLLNSDKAEQDNIRAAFRAGRAGLTQLLREYADNFVSDVKDQIFLDEYRYLSGQWVGSTEKAMSLGALTRERRTRFFRESTGTTRWCLAPAVQRLVEFRALNLIDPVGPIEGQFDVISCRNVLMWSEPAIACAATSSECANRLSRRSYV